MTMEYIGALKFEAEDFDLTSLPDNKRAARDAAAIMPYIRMSALLLRQSDEELEASVRISDLGRYMDLAEEIGAALDAKRQDCGILEAGFTRLLVVIERVLAEEAVCTEYHAEKEVVPHSHLAGIRARLHSGKRPFKPHLVTVNYGS